MPKSDSPLCHQAVRCSWGGSGCRHFQHTCFQVHLWISTGVRLLRSLAHALGVNPCASLVNWWCFSLQHLSCAQQDAPRRVWMFAHSRLDHSRSYRVHDRRHHGSWEHWQNTGFWQPCFLWFPGNSKQVCN